MVLIRSLRQRSSTNDTAMYEEEESVRGPIAGHRMSKATVGRIYLPLQLNVRVNDAVGFLDDKISTECKIVQMKVCCLRARSCKQKRSPAIPRAYGEISEKRSTEIVASLRRLSLKKNSD